MGRGRSVPRMVMSSVELHAAAGAAASDQGRPTAPSACQAMPDYWPGLVQNCRGA